MVVRSAATASKPQVAAPAQIPSTITLAFEQMLADLRAGRLDSLRVGLESLQLTLFPISGMQKRSPQGGAKYRALYVLDSVLLADNLRNLCDDAASTHDESNLLLSVVKQSSSQWTVTLAMRGLGNSWNGGCRLPPPAARLLRSLSLCLEPDLAQHLIQAGLKVPKKSTLYQFRQNVDYCSMLWAREHLFAASLPEWHTHLRLDSSPQYARNYLVGELDRIDLADISPHRVDEVWPESIRA